VLVRALTGAGDSTGARTALVELTNIATLVGTVPLRGAASYAAGYVALGENRADSARQHFEDAVDLYLQSGAPFEGARARLELARALGALGRTDAATAEAHRAHELLTELKAEVEIVKARKLLETLAAGADGSLREAKFDKTAGLTRRELEVLRLVAEGLSNQTIAERLFVSEHTVHRHLANILGKLSVSTRAAAVAQAARRGLLV